MKFKDLNFLLNYAIKKPSKLVRYWRLGYVCGSDICINDELKVVYVVNPKVASTSILEMLSGINREELQKSGIDIAEIRKQIGTSQIHSKSDLKRLQQQGYFVFTFVRNPYERAVSFFKNKFKDQGTQYLKPVLFAEKCGFESCQNFNDVLAQIISTPSSIGDAHFISQSDVLYGKSPGFEFDFIGKMESFDEDYAILQEKVGFLPEVKKLNTTKKQKASVDEFFSPEQKKQFFSKFRRDFELFGYDK